MNRTAVALVVVLLVGAIAVPAGALALGGGAITAGDTPAQAAPASPPSGGNETNDSAVAPGEAFAGAVGAQQSELSGEVEARAYGLALARAGGDASKARILKERVRGIEARLAALADRKRELIRAHDNGSVSDGRFRAEMARVAAEIRTLERLANLSEAAARDLRPGVRTRQGIDATAIRTLRREAQNLTGPDVAEIARSIAGPSVETAADGGRPPGVGPPIEAGPNATERNDTGPPDGNGAGSSNDGEPPDVGNATDEANETVDEANETVDETEETANDTVGDAKNATDSVTNGTAVDSGDIGLPAREDRSAKSPETAPLGSGVSRAASDHRARIFSRPGAMSSSR